MNRFFNPVFKSNGWCSDFLILPSVAQKSISIISPFKLKPVLLEVNVPMTKIVRGEDFMMMLAENGSVWEMRPHYTKPRQIYFSGAVDIACGSHHTMILRDNGSIVANGSNKDGQMGIGVYCMSDYDEFHQVSTLRNNIVRIACGERHSMALESNGKVIAWGNNTKNQLGFGTVDETSGTPLHVPNLNDIQDIGCGANFSMAKPIFESDELYCWGDNSYGQLGAGLSISSRASPYLMIYDKVKSISIGQDFCVANLNDGTCQAWGNGQSGQLGNGVRTIANRPETIKLPGPVDSVKCFRNFVIAEVVVYEFNFTTLLQSFIWGHNYSSTPIPLRQ